MKISQFMVHSNVMPSLHVQDLILDAIILCMTVTITPYIHVYTHFVLSYGVDSANNASYEGLKQTVVKSSDLTTP